MPLGLGAGIVIGAAGTFALTRLEGRRGNKQDANRAAEKEAAPLLMPGASALETVVSLETSNSLMSALLQQLWPQINKIIIKAVKESAEPAFTELPYPLRGMYIQTLDLGKEPIQLENFVVHPVVDNTLRIELEINWDSTCDILLAGLPGGNTIGVKQIKLRSRLVIVCKPILDAAPVASSAQVAFINQPYIDLNFTGLADVADWANMRPMVDKAIKDGLSRSLVLPQRTFVKIDPKCNFIKAYHRPLGVLRVKLVKGRDFPTIKSGLVKYVPDMYCTLGLGDKQWTSSVIKDRNDPEWNETFDFILSDYGQVLDIHAMDKELMMSDKDMGSIQVSAVDLVRDGGKREYTLVCQPPEGKKTKKKTPNIGKVTLECELLPFCNDITSITAEPQEPTPNKIKGMVVVFVAKLANLPVPKEEAASYIKVTVRDKEHKTGIVKYDPEAAAAAEAAAVEEVKKAEAPTAEEENGDAKPAMVDAVLHPEFNAAFQIPIYESDPPSKDGVTFDLINANKSLGKFNIPADIYMVMKDELHESTTNIAGALLHCGVEAFGLETNDKTIAPMEIASADTSADALV